MKVTTLQIIMNLCFGKQKEKIYIHYYEGMLANPEDIQELAIWTFSAVFQKHIYFCSEEKKNLGFKRDHTRGD